MQYPVNVFAVPLRALQILCDRPNRGRVFFPFTVMPESGTYRLVCKRSVRKRYRHRLPLRATDIKEERRKMLYIKPTATMHYSRRHGKAAPWENPPPRRITCCSNS